MLAPDKDLELIFEHAVVVASKHKHEYITLEHFLYSMVIHESFSKILKDFGTDTDSLVKDLENYIKVELKDIANNRT